MGPLGFTLNSGQVCVAGTRIIVQESIYEEFLAELAAMVKQFKLGDGFDFEQGVNFGPLISREHFQSVLSYIEKGKAEGARFVTGGAALRGSWPRETSFIPPSLQM